VYEIRLPRRQPATHRLVGGVAAHVEHLQAGTHVAQRLGNLRTAGAGHDDIGEQQVETAPVLPGDTDRLVSALR
jgi:hypothetical protein